MLGELGEDLLATLQKLGVRASPPCLCQRPPENIDILQLHSLPQIPVLLTLILSWLLLLKLHDIQKPWRRTRGRWWGSYRSRPQQGEACVRTRPAHLWRRLYRRRHAHEMLGGLARQVKNRGHTQVRGGCVPNQGRRRRCGGVTRRCILGKYQMGSPEVHSRIALLMGPIQVRGVLRPSQFRTRLQRPQRPLLRRAQPPSLWPLRPVPISQ
mmetsp:Transcript_17241/g.38028  ORF Transcript_17241/g.38028 Transcript_17241/m.38028 type:complete len:211 (-) Transcript_17241:1135-1767(-)